MKLVFFGSGEFGVPTLEALSATGHDIPAVVTQPDRPAGRGGRMRPTPIREKAEALGLTVLAPEKPNTPEFEADLRALAPDLCVVVAYGHLIRRRLLDVPRLGFINLHASLLPAYRGAAPVPRAIMNGETVSGVSIFQLDEKFDTGDVIASESLPIEAGDTSGTYLAKLAPLGGRLMARVALDIQNGCCALPTPQDCACACPAPKLAKNDGRIDWTRPYREIECLVRALQPWPQAFTTLPVAGGEVRVNVAAIEPAFGVDASGREPGGVIVADAKQGLVIATGDRPARLVRLQPEGKRVMADGDFLRGTKIKA